MEEHEKIELRSDDVQEILGTPPNWLVRWGTTIVFFTIACLIGSAWWINYPDLLDAKAVISTVSPPVEVVARTEGPLQKLLVVENEKVTEGQVLAVLQSTADYEAIKALDGNVDKWQKVDLDSLKFVTPPVGLNVGEAQQAYSVFIQNLGDYKFVTSDKLEGAANRVGSLRKQITNLRKQITLNDEIVKQAEAALKVANENYEQAQDLYGSGLISLSKLRTENGKLIASRQEVQSLNARNVEKEIEITNIQKSIGEIGVDDRQGSSNSGLRLRESLNNLKSAIVTWKQQYLLKAPISGLATMNAEVFSEQQFVRRGQTVMTIAPPEGQKLIARVSIPVLGAGKVKSGQRVLIKLDNYPYEEFGAIEGVVTSKSLVPTDNAYSIIVDLPNGLLSTRHIELSFEQKLQGVAQIVTENRRFIDRFFDKIFAKVNTY